MRGVFFEPTGPPLIRDELKYDVGFKDSLQKTMEQEEFKRRAVSNTPKEFQAERPKENSNYEPLRNRYKNEVQEKVTQIPLSGQQSYQAFNYKGYESSFSEI
mgnify:CR=1 FL=1